MLITNVSGVYLRAYDMAEITQLVTQAVLRAARQYMLLADMEAPHVVPSSHVLHVQKQQPVGACLQGCKEALLCSCGAPAGRSSPARYTYIDQRQ